MDIEAFGNKSQGCISEQMAGRNGEGLINIIMWNRWTILLTTVGILVAAFFYIIKATPIYTSESRVYVEQTGPKIINEYEGVMTRSSNYLHTQGELIKSSPILTDVAENSQIRNLNTFTNIDNLAGYLKKNLRVAIGERDDIIRVSFDSPYPAEAAAVVNAVMDSYVNYHSVQKRSTVTEVLRILQKEKVKRDEELSNKFTELIQFTKDNGVVSFENNGGNVVFERLSKLSSALTEAQLVTLNAKADYEAVSSMVDEPEKIRQFAGISAGTGPQVLGDDRENQLRTALRQSEIELDETLNHCTEDHPSVRAIRMKIQRIRQELDNTGREFADAYVEVTRLRYVAAGQRESELATSFEQQRRASQELGVKTTEYTVLQSELKRAESICEILDNRIKELNVTEDTGALNISILEVAKPARSPSKPQKARVMTMALAFGLIIGISLALLRDWMDYRLRSSDEISAMLGIPVLGEVPAISNGRKKAGAGRYKKWLKLINFHLRKSHIRQDSDVSVIARNRIKLREDTLIARTMNYRTILAADRNKKQVSPVSTPDFIRSNTDSQHIGVTDCGQIVRLMPRSVAAEAYRTIRTSIFFGMQQGGARTILVTSPAPGDGKSTLASNLAIAMAQAGQKTLLIDADLRKPTQHKIFNISNETGLSSIIVRASKPEEAIKPGPVKGLYLLPCGPRVSNPSEILNSESFAFILANLSKCYDRIIIDSPPVMPVADSKVVAARCDITLLVVRAEKTTRKLLQHAKDSLTSVGGHVLGTIVNGVASKHGRYGYGRYYGGYGYGYNYGSSSGGYYDDDEENNKQNFSRSGQEISV
jgi:capsular exopolysaccharide synthesis family protein